MTITQTVDIPADHRVFFDFPKEIPEGKARIELKVIPFVKKDEKPEPFLKVSAGATPHTDALLDILSKIDGDINPDEIRTERLAKHI